MTPLPKDTALLVKIKHTRPVEMTDFVATMGAVNTLFEDFCKINGDSTEAKKAKLYVQKVEHGSIELFLTEAISSIVLPLLENMNIILEFAAHLKGIVEYYTEGKGKKPELNKNQLRAAYDVFSITAGDGSAITEIGAINIGTGNSFYGCSFNFAGGNSAQNQIRKEEQALSEEKAVNAVYKRQFMTLFQMRSASGGDAGNRAVINTISPKPLPVVFETDSLKRDILGNNENPMQKAYLVDVEELTANGKRAAFKVIALHDVVCLDD